MSTRGKRKRESLAKSDKPPCLRRRRIRCQTSGAGSVRQTGTKKSDDAVGERNGASDLQQTIRQAAQTVFDALGTGLTEAVYRDALAVELEARRLCVRSDREVILPIRYTGRYVGFCRSDIVLLCSNTKLSAKESVVAPPPLVVELKAVTGRLSVSNVQQLSAYMRLLGSRSGVLVNFVQGVDQSVRQALKEKASVIGPAAHVESVECVFIDSSKV